MAIRRYSIIKQPREKLSFDVLFGYQQLPYGVDQIISAHATAEKWPRYQPSHISDASNEILFSQNPIIINVPNKHKVRIMLINGEHNYDYCITISVEFDNGLNLEDEIYVRVREE